MKYDRKTVFSVDRVYRYTLWREWHTLPLRDGLPGFVLFICLNPSTADEKVDDPTIRRCVQFAKDWGYAGFCMVNLFAYRATKPSEMKRYSEPVGPDNDRWLVALAKEADLVVVGWGRHGSHQGRGKEAVKLLGGFELKCLGINSDGTPKHPLYLPKVTALENFS